jgi:hypothetical protein
MPVCTADFLEGEGGGGGIVEDPAHHKNALYDESSTFLRTVNSNSVKPSI